MGNSDISMESTYPSRSEKGYTIKLTHKPSGQTVEGEGWNLWNLKNRLEKDLAHKVRKSEVVQG